MASDSDSFCVEFPDFSSSILQKLNQQRKRGQLCDITVVIQGQRFRAHRAVLAASSPYFCDQVLLRSSACVVLPDVMQPRVFESLLQSCYTGVLRLPAGEVVGFLTAASFLQMWHVVDKCTELLDPRSATRGGEAFSFKDGEEAPAGGAWEQDITPEQENEGRDVGGADSPTSVEDDSGCGYSTWVQVKAEQPEDDEDGGLFPDDVNGDHQDPCAASGSFSSPDGDGSDRGHAYDPHLDLLGGSSSMAELSADEAEAALTEHGLDGGADKEGHPPSQTPGRDRGLSSASGYRLFPCQCGKTFTHKSQRERHMSMHLGLRPYGCSVCGKRFKMKHHLVGHMKIHTGIKPYECSVCSKRFMWRDSFNRHVSSCLRARQGKLSSAESTPASQSC